LVLAGPALQSASVQQPVVMDTHRVVSGQFRNVLLQVTPHTPPVQAATPFAGGAAQVLQPAPQNVVLVSGWQMPLQLCVPLGQTPMQAVVVGMHAPLQSLSDPQDGTQARPSQLTVPPVGA
jgi:hypothetical protein